MRLFNSTLTLTLTLTLTSTLALALAGCDLGDKSIGDDAGDDVGGDGDGDTGDEPGDTGTPDDLGGDCGEETESIVTDLETPPAGFDLAVTSYLAQIEGSYAGTLSWLENDGPTAVAHAGTSSGLSMSVTYTGGDVVLTEVELAGQFPGEQAGGFPCSNRLDIPVTLTFATEDGLFAESFAIPVRVLSHDEEGTGPSYYFALDFAALAGTLEQSDFAFTDAVVSAVYLIGELAGPTATGSVAMEVETMDWVGFGPVASYSAERLP